MHSQLSEELIISLEPKLIEIQEIWTYIGYDSQECTKHLDTILSKINQCLNDVIREENATRLEHEKNVENVRRKVVEMSQDLRIPVYYPDRGLNIVELKLVLENKICELEELKKSRLFQIKNKLKLIRTMGSLLFKTDENIESVIKEIFDNDGIEHGSILSDKGLDRLNDALKSIQKEYEPLFVKFKTICKDLTKLVEEGVFTDKTSDQQRDLLAKYQIIANSEDQMEVTNLPQLNSENLQDLENLRGKIVKEKARTIGMIDEIRPALLQLWHRLDIPTCEQENILMSTKNYSTKSLEILKTETERCKKLKEQNLKNYLEKLRLEMKESASKCFMKAELNSDYQGMDEVTYLENKIQQLELNYTQNKDIFDSLRQYQNLWNEFFDLETKMKDPAILTNRGGILLKTEKERNRVQRELQKTESSLLNEMKEFAEANNNQEFKFPDGATFQEVINRKRMEFEEWKLANKTARRSSSAVGNRNGHPGAP